MGGSLSSSSSSSASSSSSSSSSSCSSKCERVLHLGPLVCEKCRSVANFHDLCAKSVGVLPNFDENVKEFYTSDHPKLKM